jgi:uncharacterized protein YhfF
VSNHRDRQAGQDRRMRPPPRPERPENGDAPWRVLGMSARLDLLLARYPGARTFRFGDSPALCESLLALVRTGKKTATCGAAADYAAGEPLPVVGRHDIALAWDGRPALVILTTEVTRRRFCDVDEAFALAEGENATLAGWRADHRRFFERNGGWHPEMALICERFRLVEDLGGA